MSRNALTAVQILGIIILTVALSLAAYFLGSVLAKSFLSIGSGVTHGQWLEHYRKLVMTVGGLCGALSLAWFVAARFFLKIDSPLGVGKRTVWAIVGGVTAAVCIILPYVYAGVDHVLKMSPGIPVVFLLLYGIIGYWGGSIFATPAAYKYTPLGASLVRSPRKGK